MSATNGTVASCALLCLSLASAGCEREERAHVPATPERATHTTPAATRTPAPKPPGGDATPVPTAPVTGTTQPQSPTTGATESVDPAAVAALEQMGAYLRTLRSFEVRGTMQTDEVLENGQRIQISSSGTVDVRRPDRLMAEITSDRRERRYYYDGHTFTVESPAQGYYATVDAPATLGQLVELAGDRYGIDLPMADLFLWGTDEDDLGAFTSAIDLGPSTIEGAETEHYAFRQEGLDWQIWIARGDRPLPRMLVLTTTDDDARPTYSAVYTWNVHPDHDASTFAFHPRSSAHRIALEDQLALADDTRAPDATAAH